MKLVTWKLIKHYDLSIKEAIQIAELKDQHWTHDVDSQIHWMAQNINPDDYHLMGLTEDDQLIAYLALVNVDVLFDDNLLRLVGLGNVCVDRQKSRQGLGKTLVDKANDYIQSTGGGIGILLCKKKLIEFYSHCGWETIEYNNALINNNAYVETIMMYGKYEIEKVSHISFSRNF